MVYDKLEELIRNALKDQEVGVNKIVVETGYNGMLKIYELDDEEKRTVKELENEIEQLEDQIEDLEDEIDRLEDEISELKKGD